MKKVRSDSEMRPEYEFEGGPRGVYAARYAEGTNIVKLDKDVAEFFPDSESVNRALRPLAKLLRERDELRITSDE